MIVTGLDPMAGMETANNPHPLPGAELTWREWLAQVAPHIDQSLMSPEHIALWEWVDALTPGVRPTAFLADWPRGYGKTTTMRLAMARMAVTLNRRFGLYVCSTQTTANNHIFSIRRRFEDLGIERLEDKYGKSMGWSGERLRTRNGFTLLALGLDTASIRGLNLDDLRPDLIDLDDIDSVHDSIDAAQRKYDTLTQTVIPAGSSDHAILFGQNEIHGHSVMYKFVSREADALRKRHISKVVAVRGLEFTKVPGPNPGDVDQYRIVAGESTWPGKSIAQWEEDLNESGEISFLRECQHLIRAGGRMFPKFEPDRNGEPWHVCDPFPIPAYFEIWASHDYGTRSACAFLVAAADENGDTVVIGEWSEAGWESSEQAYKVLILLHRLGLAQPQAKDDPRGPWKTRLKAIAFDYANTFPPVDPKERIGAYPVEPWWRLGLPCIRAVKDRKAGWRMMNEELTRTRTVKGPDGESITRPCFRIMRGAAPLLVNTLETASVDPKDPHELDPGFRNDHLADSARYLCMVRFAASKDPNAVLPKPFDPKNPFPDSRLPLALQSPRDDRRDEWEKASPMPGVDVE